MIATLADVLRQFGAVYLVKHILSTVQAKAWRAIVACRTALLGGQRGLITPPVGTVLNVVSSIARVNLDTVIKGMFPFRIAETLVMFLLVLFPQLVIVPARWFY